MWKLPAKIPGRERRYNVTRKKPTVADLKAHKGKGQLTMLRYFTLDEASAAEAAGIDIASVPPALVSDPQYRHAAPSIFAMTGKTHLEYGAPDEYLRFAGQMLQAGRMPFIALAAYRQWNILPANISPLWATLV